MHDNAILALDAGLKVGRRIVNFFAIPDLFVSVNDL